MYGEVPGVQLYKDNSWGRLQDREMHSAYKIYLFDSENIYLEYL
jgi:hypothetical protein